MFADKIKELRNKANLTQKEFAASIDAALSSVSKYELGTVKPRRKIIDKICEVYDVDEDWLFDGEKEAEVIAVMDEKAVETDKAAEEPREENYPTLGNNAVELTDDSSLDFDSIIVESADGRQMEVFELLSKVKKADPGALSVYIKPEENKVYYVTDTSAGSVNIW